MNQESAAVGAHSLFARISGPPLWSRILSIELEEGWLAQREISVTIIAPPGTAFSATIFPCGLVVVAEVSQRVEPGGSVLPGSVVDWLSGVAGAIDTGPRVCRDRARTSNRLMR